MKSLFLDEILVEVYERALLDLGFEELIIKGVLQEALVLPYCLGLIYLLSWFRRSI
jgi:hypothetical protein